MSYLRRAMVLALVGGAASLAPAGTVLDEDFSSIADWDDVSTAKNWLGGTHPSAFTTAGEICTLTADAKTNSDLKGWSCLDYRFATPIDHTTKTTTVDFRIRWGALSNSGEKGRVLIVFQHDYPAGGLDLTPDARLVDTSQEWWSRPAYHARLRAANGNWGGLLQYGGGADALGEYEFGYGNWLPGYISASGGGSPGAGGFGWATSGTTPLASTSWQTFRWVVTPTRQELWRDDGDDGEFSGSDLKISQDIAQDPANPDYFHYFPTFEGIRLYLNNADLNEVAYLDWVRVDVVPEPATLGLLAAGAAGALLRRRRRP